MKWKMYIGILGLASCLLLQFSVAEDPLRGLIVAKSGDNGQSTINADDLTINMDNPVFNKYDQGVYVQSNVESPNGKVSANSAG